MAQIKEFVCMSPLLFFFHFGGPDLDSKGSCDPGACQCHAHRREI